MAKSSEPHPQQSRSFDPPQEAERHRMISEAAYHLAEKRGFAGDHSLEDWLAAEQQVRPLISPTLVSEDKMPNTKDGQSLSHNPVIPETEQAGDASRSAGSKPARRASRAKAPSRFEKFAVTQAAGDGIEGDVRKRDKTGDEKLGANMADRK